MYSCVFFGHRDEDYFPYNEKIETILLDLIKDHEVDHFYSGYRGNFDKICAYIVWELKQRYPQIKNTMVLSYPPNTNFALPQFFDDAAYLLDGKVPPRAAIPTTNHRMVDLAEYIVSGIMHDFGGAFNACCYAQRRGKKIINICKK